MTKALSERTVLLDVTFVKFLFGIKCIISFVRGLYLVNLIIHPQDKCFAFCFTSIGRNNINLSSIGGEAKRNGSHPGLNVNIYSNISVLRHLTMCI